MMLGLLFRVKINSTGLTSQPVGREESVPFRHDTFRESGDIKSPIPCMNRPHWGTLDFRAKSAGTLSAKTWAKMPGTPVTCCKGVHQQKTIQGHLLLGYSCP